MAGAPGPNGKTGAASERSDQPCRSALRRVGAGHAHVRERRLDLGFAGFSRAPRIRRGAALGKAGGFRPGLVADSTGGGSRLGRHPDIRGRRAIAALAGEHFFSLDSSGTRRWDLSGRKSTTGGGLAFEPSSRRGGGETIAG